MGLIRKVISANTLGLVHWQSNGDKLVKQGKREARASKSGVKQNRNFQERLLAEQKRANDLKELELMRSSMSEPVERPPSPTQNPEGGGWWGYSDPSKKKRRG